MIQQVKYYICSIFEMTNVVMLHYFSGVEFWQSNHTIFVSQVKYVISLFKNFKTIECNPTSTPMEVGIKPSSYTDSSIINEELY
jgi:hypothetical protein